VNNLDSIAWYKKWFLFIGENFKPKFSVVITKAPTLDFGHVLSKEFKSMR
jgi:hypothetical protein